MRSFDRIALTKEIVAQEKASGIDTVKADIALDLDLNGVDSIKDNSVTVSHLPNGDSLDLPTHKVKPQKNTNAKEKPLSNIFAWNEKDSSKDKHQKVNQVLSDFQDATKESQVPATLAQHGMMTGQNVYDQKWSGDDQDAVKNFVTEELYIHTKVSLCCPFLTINSS